MKKSLNRLGVVACVGACVAFSISLTSVDAAAAADPGDKIEFGRSSAKSADIADSNADSSNDECVKLATVANKVFLEVPRATIQSVGMPAARAMTSAPSNLHVLVPSRTHIGFFQEMQVTEITSVQAQCLSQGGTALFASEGKLYCTFPEQFNRSELFFMTQQPQGCALQAINFTTQASRGWFVVSQTPELAELSGFEQAKVAVDRNQPIPVTTTFKFVAEVERLDCGAHCEDTGPGIQIQRNIQAVMKPLAKQPLFTIKLAPTFKTITSFLKGNPYQNFSDDQYEYFTGIALEGPRVVVNQYLATNPALDVTQGPVSSLAKTIAQAQIAVIENRFQDGRTVTPSVRADFERRVLREVAIARMHEATTDSQWQATVQEVKPLMSPKDKKEFLAALGGDFLSRYDHVRNASNTTLGKNPVTMLQLLAAARTPNAVAGVCRDMSHAVGLVAEQLGFTDVYIVGFQSVALHTELIARDPEDPNKILKFDYNDLTSTVQTSEVRALTLQNDLSLNYYVSKPDASPVAVLPSELAIALLAETGGDVQNLDFFARPVSTFMGSAKVNLGRGWKLYGMGGYLSTGGTLGGGGIGGSYGNVDEGMVAGEGAVAVVYQRVDSLNLEALRLYVRYTQDLNSPWLRLGKLLRARFATVTLLQGALNGTSPTTVDLGTGQGAQTLPGAGNRIGSSTTLGGGALTTVSTQVRLTTPGGGTTVSLEAGRQYAVTLSDARTSDINKLTLVRNVDYASLLMSQHIAGRVRGWGQGALGRRGFGKQYLLQGGLTDERSATRLTLGYQNSLRQKFPYWAPGLAPQRYAGLELGLNRVVIGGEYREYLDMPQRRAEIRAVLKADF